MKDTDLWFESGDERHRIVAIEYRDGKPFSVVTEMHWDHSGKPWFIAGRDTPNGVAGHDWDFEWCNRDGVCRYDLSGFGGKPRFCAHRFCEPSPPPAELWIAEGTPVFTYTRNCKERRVESDAELLKLGYKRLRRPKLLKGRFGDKTRNPFDAAWEGRAIYCDRCDDYLPDENPCEHLEWCDECASWVYVDTNEFHVDYGGGSHECVEEEIETF